VTALGLPTVFAGVMVLPKVGPWIIIAGVLLVFFGTFRWAFERP
jgi:hypothetical protein